MQPLTDSLQTTQALIHQATIAAKRTSGDVHLLAVSKKHSVESMRHIYRLGQRAFGENYVQEACEKQLLLSDLEIQWHFIGPIQSNKTRQIAEHFHWVQSVDRLKIAERLSQQRPSSLLPLNICLQVNIDNEATKSGFAASELLAAANKIAALPNLNLRGVMAIPAPRESFDEQLKIFQQVQQLFEALAQRFSSVDTLSMGMSGDMGAAIAAGSTMVRVGTGIFGARK